jgi:hypothetical protein
MCGSGYGSRRESLVLPCYRLQLPTSLVTSQVKGGSAGCCNSTLANR